LNSKTEKSKKTLKNKGRTKKAQQYNTHSLKKETDLRVEDELFILLLNENEAKKKKYIKQNKNKANLLRRYLN